MMGDEREVGGCLGPRTLRDFGYHSFSSLPLPTFLLLPRKPLQLSSQISFSFSSIGYTAELLPILGCIFFSSLTVFQKTSSRPPTPTSFLTPPHFPAVNTVPPGPPGPRLPTPARSLADKSFKQVRGENRLGAIVVEVATFLSVNVCPPASG